MTLTGTIVDVKGIKVGQVQNVEALTGCTVLLMEEGAVCGVDVRGSAPGTRETDLLDPSNLVEQVHAIVLTGGSAFGLDSASGVMKYLEERGIGLDTGFATVPIVPAACLFDLPLGDPKVRPDQEMGYLAASIASVDKVEQGNVGAGTGASVGKMCGFAHAMKGGLGSVARVYPNGLVIGAIVAVNAVGEVRDMHTGEVLAGALDESGKFRNILTSVMGDGFTPIPSGTNTTIGVVASNARLTKAQAKKVAQMSHNGLARTIYPVHTMYDGDTIFAVGTGEIEASVDLIGTLSADVLAEAVMEAIKHAEGAGGLPSYRDRKQA
ncbi:P1 family peptidase [Brevibacillus fluminis]|uniref:P1 family peptidase n=1 Tax=Brevibacillus fluminis TaxID=511487 RepID=UPI003F8CD402